MPLSSPVLVPGQGVEALSGHHSRPAALGRLNQHGWASVRECALGPVLCVEVSQARLAALTQQWRRQVCGCLHAPGRCSRWKCVWVVARLPACPHQPEGALLREPSAQAGFQTAETSSVLSRQTEEVEAVCANTAQVVAAVV